MALGVGGEACKRKGKKSNWMQKNPGEQKKEQCHWKGGTIWPKLLNGAGG